MDINLAVCQTLIRVGLPLILLTSVVIRQNVFSGIYLLFFLAGPFLPKPTAKSIRGGSVGFYLKLLTLACFLISGSQFVFQIWLLASHQKYTDAFDYCTTEGEIFYIIGLNRLDSASFISIFRLFALDFIIFTYTVIVYVISRKVYSNYVKREELEENRIDIKTFEDLRNGGGSGDGTEGVNKSSDVVPDAGMRSVSVDRGAGDLPTKSNEPFDRKKWRKHKATEIARFVSELLFHIFLCGSAVLNPSLTSSFYLILFLTVVTWMSSNHKLGQGFEKVRLFVCFYTFCHIFLLFVYQFDSIGSLVPDSNLYARLFGLIEYHVVQNCTQYRELEWNDVPINSAVHPFFLIALYFISAAIVRRRLFNPDKVLEKKRSSKDVRPLDASAPSGGVTRVCLPTSADDESRKIEKAAKSVQMSPSSYQRKPSESGTSNSEDEECSLLAGTSMPLREYAPIYDTTPLLSGPQQKSYRALKPRKVSQSLFEKSGIDVDSNGSVIWKNDPGSGLSSPRTKRNSSEVMDPSSLTPTTTKMDRSSRLAPVIYLLNIIKKGSYAITLIVMMTWSITYHSWLTFILLFWSCIIWMMPNSRQACLRSSPYLVTYAILLILGQYIYSLNLSDSELPQKISGIDLNEIGIKKYYNKSYQTLVFKILFTLMFWITLRQSSEERARDNLERSRRANLSDDGASRISKKSQRHMSLATINLPPDFSPGLLWLLNAVHGLLVKYWIWIVALMLMVMSLNGNKVVLYRVFYMVFFLGFVLMFQISYRRWRNLMYAFWLLVIVYSMVVLIAIYTYQFNNFPQKIWGEYLHLSMQMQRDLGLEVFSDPLTLFQQLLTPTFFLIITIIQLHFLHKDFLDFSKYDDRSVTTMPSEETRLTPSAMTASTAPGSSDHLRDDLIIDLEKDDYSSSFTKPSKEESLKTSGTPGRTQVSGSTSSFVTPECQPSETRNVRISEVKQVAAELKDRAQGVWDTAKPSLYWFYETLWRFLEIHMMKVIFLFAVLTAIDDICAANFAYIVLVVIALPCPRFHRTICHVFCIISSALILSKMLFQLPSLNNMTWNTTCTYVHGLNNVSCAPFDKPIDNRQYIGFRFAKDDLFAYLKDDLLMILVLTLNTVVFIRQSVHRFRTGEECPQQGVIFRDITRKEADTTVLNCLKFLANYFFYKFGLEVTVLALVSLIAFRMDFVSTIMALFVILFSLCSRRLVRKVWVYFIFVMIVLIPVEYLLVLGIPPGLCTQYPWFQYPVVLQQWFFLPSYANPPNANIMLCDFLVLLLACQQWHVFKIEFSSIDYSGGDNSEYGTEKFNANKQQIVDFFVFKKAPMDTIKSVTFSCFFWVSLAVLFLSATRGDYNIFGLGYVLGCFLFLWKGNEFYLKPVKTVIRVWKILIAYTTISIFIKTVMEVLGCLYVAELRGQKLCWLGKLLGIACSQRMSGFYSDCMIEPLPIINESSCIVKTASSSIRKDLLCFLVLMIQKRIFGSHYFSYLVREVKAQQVQASRGAELIHEIQAKEVMEQEQAEREVMEKIKTKVERIRSLQRKGKEAKTKTHYQAVRSGDYHMFEDPDSEEIDLEKKPRKSLIPDPVGDELKRIASAKGFTTFFSKLVKGDFSDEDEEVDVTRVSEESTGVGESSKDSAIVSVDREIVQEMDISAVTAYTGVPSTTISIPEDMPSTSRASEEELKKMSPAEGTEEKEPLLDTQTKESFWGKVKRYFFIAKHLILSGIISVTAQLNEVSRDYRYVSRRLAVEKRALKVLFEIEELDGVEYDVEWKKETLQKISGASVPQSVRAKSSRDSLDKKKSLGHEDKVKSGKKETSLPVEEDEEDDYGLHANPLVRFLRAVIYAVISQSEFLCYALVVIDQIVNSSLLSLPLPLMVFLWGCLSVPRPSKTFWISVITYTEAVIIAKYVYNFPWPWTDTSKSTSLWAPMLVGDTNKLFLQTQCDLALLLVLFFHRFMLKTLGLWDLESEFKHPKTNNYNKRSSVTNSMSSSSKEGESTPSGLRRRKTNKVAPMSSKQATEESEPPQAIKSTECTSDENGTSDLEETIYQLMEAPSSVSQIFRKLVIPIKLFFKRILYPPFRIAKDAYWAMFFCDFVNFFIVVFNYNAFGNNSSSADITTYFEENRVPALFLIMLLVQFALMITDRALYLRKNIKGRLKFHLAIVLFIHIYLFLVLPIFSNSSEPRSAPQYWYIFKSIYLLLSATQIKSGYPTRILGNCFAKKYSILHRYLFKAYTMIPFLYDMRLIMDWVWTDTSLNLEEWAIMEDMFKQLFERKCDRCFEEKFPEPEGNARRRGPKYFQGWLYLAMIIGAIWFPLVLFALGGTVGTSNRPSLVEIQIEFVGYQKLVKMTAAGTDLLPLTPAEWEKLKKTFKEDTSRFKDDNLAFLDNYDIGDASLAKLNGVSTSVWSISPPSVEELKERLSSNDTITVKITWYITRNQTKRQNADTLSYKSQSFMISDPDTRSQLVNMLNDTKSHSYNVTLSHFFPNFIKSVSTTEPNTVLPYKNYESRSVSITLNSNQESWWWQVIDNCSEINNPFREWDASDNCNTLPLVIFSEKKFPEALGFVSGYGILGLYTTFVFVVSRIIRGFFDNLSFYVMYTQMPYVDRVLQLCLDIYLVRERREFGLEEDLYAKLLFLYRSPETLIKWTKPPREAIKSGDDTDVEGALSP